MCKHLLVIMSLAFSAGVLAQSASCNTAASEKKLVGAAKTAFLKKCEMESKAMSTIATTREKKSTVDFKGGYGGCGHDAASM